MELISLCPFRAGVVLWETVPGQPWLTVLAKGTFSLVQGEEAVIAAAQVPIGPDTFWDDHSLASLYAPSDLAPIKRAADVMLVGHARAPGGTPVTSLVAQLRVGDLIKTVHVRGDQRWIPGAAGLTPGAPEPFSALPLRYERAARGPENPVGIDEAAPPVMRALARPNLIAGHEGALAGFGPIAPSWEARRALLDEAGLAWAEAFMTAGAAPGPPPEGLDLRFFNAAPRDQQVDAIPAGARVALDHLHPEHARFEGRLPAIAAQAFHVDATLEHPSEIAMRCDTLWIDADQGVVVLTWRGVLDLRGMDRAGAVVIVADPSGRRREPAEVAAMLRDGGAAASQRERIALPSDDGEPDEVAEDLEVTHVQTRAQERRWFAVTAPADREATLRGPAPPFASELEEIADQDRDEDVELTVALVNGALALGAAPPSARAQRAEDTRDEDVELTVALVDGMPENAAATPFAATGTGDEADDEADTETETEPETGTRSEGGP